ncbi:methylated-DNA--[protein]-cysteine S-methyltransferase [Enterococcus olivae]
MKVLYTGTIEIDGENYILAATEQGLSYFGQLEKSKTKFPRFFKGYTLVEDPAKVQSYVQPIKEYFQKKQRAFSFPIDLIGTPFQKQVWQELLKVPYGSTVSYSELAQKIDRPTAYRAVAKAVGRNNLLVIVPCHRVLGKDGSLTGFGGGLPLKRKLLSIEGHPAENWK